MNIDTNNFSRKLLISVIAALVGAAASAHAGDSKEPPEQAGISPLIILSEKVGDVGREAIGSGVPVMQGTSMADFPGMKVLYADIDSINKDSYSVVVDSIRRVLNQGTMVALETSDFNFEKLRNFVSLNFPAIDSAGIDDVAVLLRQDGGLIRAERIDPSELAMYAGVPFENTTAGEYSRLVIDEESSSRALPSGIKYTLRFSAKAYESAPTDSTYSLKYNGTYVDVWRKMYYPTTECIVAWHSHYSSA